MILVATRCVRRIGTLVQRAFALAVVASAWAVAAASAANAQALPLAQVSPGDKLEYWLGYGNATPRSHWSHFGYAGFEGALNLTNLYATGPVMRAEFSAGAYKPSFSFFSGTVLFGWREAVGPGFLTLYGGPDVLWNNAPNNFYVHGPNGGVRTALQYQVSAPVGGVDLLSIASYSSIADAFSFYVRPGYRLTSNFRFGPEGSYYIDRYYHEERLGGFFAYWFPDYGTLWVGGGWLNPQRNPNTSDGYYGYVSWGVTLQ